MKLWNFEIPDELLTDEEATYLACLPEKQPLVQWIWSEMDAVWDNLHLDNNKPLIVQNDKILKYYSHPIWLVNGIFTAQDQESKSHRNAVAQFIHSNNIKHIADYGGGFGELALTIVDLNVNATVDIVEPYPSKVGSYRIKEKERVTVINKLVPDRYECIVAQDVLEHVENPIEIAFALANSVQTNGHLLFLNCFHPVIKCHLPSTFHLRHNFKQVMKAMGLTFIGNIPGAEHGQVFKKVGPVIYQDALKSETISKLVGPIKNKVSPIINKVRFK